MANSKELLADAIATSAPKVETIESVKAEIYDLMERQAHLRFLHDAMTKPIQVLQQKLAAMRGAPKPE